MRFDPTRSEPIQKVRLRVTINRGIHKKRHHKKNFLAPPLVVLKSATYLLDFF
ncbi:hypothetical protein HanIR_Chr11g0515931 [Helianthus annuus]|nr:hypothetical protein HanIR_Chr11g0515931 [Helianthus annuus]